jgi:predicted amidohydrolase YtcJ
MIISGGPIYTLEVKCPLVESVVVRDGLIVWAGSAQRADSLKGPGTRLLDLQGSVLLPGLVDSHCHLLSLGKSLNQLNLTSTISPTQIRAMVLARQQHTPPGTWIAGRGWDQNDWPSPEFPSWRDLEGTEANPVILRRIDGHAAWVNKTALALCELNRDTPDPPGGRLLRDPDGQLTGVLVDNAMDLVLKRLPKPSLEERAKWLEAAIQECHRVGLTGVHDAGVDAATLDLYRQFRAEGRLTLRVYAMLSDEDHDFLDEQLEKGPQSGDPFLTVRAVKLYADGALGSRGAALLEPYDDDPTNSGLLINPPGYLLNVTKKALKAGFQVCTHAIGDRGNRITLDAYEEAQRQAPPGDYRLRLEHVQVISPQDIPRLADLDVVASMQPTHATSDMPWAEKRLGPQRVRRAYAWRSVLKTGGRLAFGSDFPIESPNPLLGIYAAVTRQDTAGNPPGGWQPAERLNMLEAMAGFSSQAAYAAFQEEKLGTITVGKLADFTVLDQDPFSVTPANILKIKVKHTIVNGEILYTQDP